MSNTPASHNNHSHTPAPRNNHSHTPLSHSQSVRKEAGIHALKSGVEFVQGMYQTYQALKEDSSRKVSERLSHAGKAAEHAMTSYLHAKKAGLFDE